MNSDNDLPATGADLARIMLRRAQAVAKNKPTTVRKPKPRPTNRWHNDGRDPKPLGGIITQVVIDNQWEGGKAGGDLVHQWPTLIGKERAAHWKATGFDEDTATLTVVCDSDSWATSLRLFQSQVVAEINKQVTGSPLRGLDVHVHSGQGPAARRSAEAEAADLVTETTTPILRPERGAEPTAEYRAQRDRLRDATVLRTVSAPPRSRLFDDAYGTLREPTNDLPQDPAAATRAARSGDEHARALARARRERGHRPPDAQPAVSYVHLTAS
ncbi:DciA family protein [Streptomyces sp. NPDC058268]|uniref:DciA family protein n=1 Tax=Streptomyces sp. NPDC058268 TaxID=3346413 RepID=UPI0036EA9B67